MLRTASKGLVDVPFKKKKKKAAMLLMCCITMAGAQITHGCVSGKKMQSCNAKDPQTVL